MGVSYATDNCHWYCCGAVGPFERPLTRAATGSNRPTIAIRGPELDAPKLTIRPAQGKLFARPNAVNI
jgi:hypothetical protein